LTQFTNVTDTQTDTAWRHRRRLCIASRGKKWYKTGLYLQWRTDKKSCMSYCRWHNFYEWSAVTVFLSRIVSGTFNVE